MTIDDRRNRPNGITEEVIGRLMAPIPSCKSLETSQGHGDIDIDMKRFAIIPKTATRQLSTITAYRKNWIDVEIAETPKRKRSFWLEIAKCTVLRNIGSIRSCSLTAG